MNVPQEKESDPSKGGEKDASKNWLRRYVQTIICVCIVGL